MKYWIVVASKDHVLQGVNGGFAQACHGKAAPLKRMTGGDLIIYYSSKHQFGDKTPYQKFTAIGRIKDDQVYSHPINEHTCGSRINVDFFDSKEIHIRPLLDDLSFIKDKTRWGFPFRKGILEISVQDFELIANQMLEMTSNLYESNEYLN